MSVSGVLAVRWGTGNEDFRTATHFIAIAYLRRSRQACTCQSAAARDAEGWRTNPPLAVMPSSTLNSMESFVTFPADLVTLRVLLGACGADRVKLKEHWVQRPGLPFGLAGLTSALSCLAIDSRASLAVESGLMWPMSCLPKVARSCGHAHAASTRRWQTHQRPG